MWIAQRKQEHQFKELRRRDHRLRQGQVHQEAQERQGQGVHALAAPVNEISVDDPRPPARSTSIKSLAGVTKTFPC
jgi:hypothetical protein